MNLVARAIIAGTLLVAGLIKLSEPESFAQDIANYRLVWNRMSYLLAFVLPPLEVLTGLGIFVPKYRQAALLIAGALFAAFAVAVGSAVIRGLDVSCGCFGVALRVSYYHVALNLGGVLACIYLYRDGTDPSTG